MLFSPLIQRSLTLRNRIVVSPMCQYSAVDGVPNHWHLVHLGSRAVGGAAVVMAEASAVSPEGRISPGDTGIWNAQQVEAWKPITDFIRSQGSIAAIQIAHAGRKAATDLPWNGGAPLPAGLGGWPVVAPSAVPHAPGYPVPDPLDEAGLARMRSAFVDAARNAVRAGFQIIEVHAAHGYLLHEFLSPLSNQRDDRYGGSLQNRMRFPLEVVAAVRAVVPAELPVWVRISAVDWDAHGWTLDDSVAFADALKVTAVDLVDVSSGGLLSNASITTGPGYQVPFAARIRTEAGIATGAVGEITGGRQADAILRAGHADLILMARESLRDPYFPLRAAQELGQGIEAPVQYRRGWG